MSTASRSPLGCSALTKKGLQCRAAPIKGTDKCLLHSDPERVAELAKQGAEASARIRKDRVSQRQKQSEDAKLTLTDRIRREVAARAGEFATALVQRAIDEPNSQAAAMVLDRVEGRVPQAVEHLNGPKQPEQMSVEELERWLSEGLEQIPETEPTP